jgi:hypothetical protein
MPWDKNTFIWDESDNTENPVDEIERLQERWEGVGGYSMPKCNFRREYDTDFSGRFGLYWSPVDQRIHLVGAERGDLYVDYDYDMKPDMVFLYEDTDSDGFFDLWQVDVDADGSIDREYRDKRRTAKRLTLEYAPMHDLFVEQLDKALASNDRVISAMKALLGDAAVAPMERWFSETMPNVHYAAKKLAASKENQRYYQDMTREYLFDKVKEYLAAKGKPLTEDEIEAYGRGDYLGFATILEDRWKQKP